MEQNAARHLAFSPARIWVIGTNTITEVIRQKVFYVFLLFGLVLIGTSNFFSEFSFNTEIKSIMDTSLGAIKIFTFLIAVVGTGMLLPTEIENRTIYTILTKPVYRVEFILGKFVGMSLLMLLVTVLMSLLFGGVLYFKEQALIAANVGDVTANLSEDKRMVLESIHAQMRNPDLLKAIFLIYLQSVLLVGMTIMISTFATSALFSIIIMVTVYLCGHLKSIAEQVWQANPSILGEKGLKLMGLFIPDFQRLTLADDVIVGKAVSMSYFWSATGYGLLYTIVVLVLAALIFEEKEL